MSTTEAGTTAAKGPRRIPATPGPRTLAALRITIGLGVLLGVQSNLRFRVPPDGLRFPPHGTAWLDFLPVSQALYTGAVLLGAAAALCLALGWRIRITAWVACAAVFYSGWATTLTGKVDHGHHLMWVLAVLAVAPCAEVWAIQPERPKGSYQWPVTTVAALLGLIYLGAGLAKFRASGWEWGWSDNLTNIMLALSWEKGQPIVQWLVDWPLASRLLGTAGLLFELTFLPLVVWPRTRRWVWPAGLLFHWGTWLILGIPFLGLQLLYVVFLPWDRGVKDRASTASQRYVSVLLVSAVALFSVLGIQKAWPVASYPGFEQSYGSRTLAVEADGVLLSETLLAEWVGPQRATPLAWRAILSGKGEELAEWFGASELQLVVIDMSTGEITPHDLDTPSP